jgi:hypothetical protein
MEGRLNMSKVVKIVPQVQLDFDQTVAPIVGHYYSALVDAVDALLSVFAAMSFSDRTKPLCLMFETPSGYGKTAVLQMVFGPKGSEVEQYVYRSDKFTPKAFVSHAANVKKEELAKIDLLPKLDGKVLVTKELAPLFRGREQDLQDNFSILISVLDGKGFTSDTGARGQRGYEGRIVFNWVGATTPLPAATHRLMSQLGTRLLFYEVQAKPPSEEELLEYAMKDEADEAEEECRKVVNEFIIELFQTYPVSSVSSDSIGFSETVMTGVVRWARFLVAARAEIKFEKIGSGHEAVAAMPPEGPWKVVNYFKELARGHALIHGRTEVDSSDIDLVAHVALSSVPGHLRPLVMALIGSNEVDTGLAADICGVSIPTARGYLKQLSLLGIARLKKGSAMGNDSDRIGLAPKYRWLHEQP